MNFILSYWYGGCSANLEYDYYRRTLGKGTVTRPLLRCSALLLAA